ncbi:hypothetical protein [Pleionea sp. CnH1-48]|uniref:hypothetical protein n=1 Tax=Pleionea sp. CnH1-48 TaxID=2954494 RepID=UPI002097F3E8|nr:hypothetical protein [Pleionea sp. CnH1-48]MCO7226584.1 hypothetical protein [Pleionea sp. CnH1-48]
MPIIDRDTLLVAVQSVYESINRFEALLKSETLSDPENITELLVSYDEAFKVLKGIYLEELERGASLPLLESILVEERD